MDFSFGNHFINYCKFLLSWLYIKIVEEKLLLINLEN